MLAAPIIFQPDNGTGETEITICFGRHLPIHWLDGDERSKVLDTLELLIGRPVVATCQLLLTSQLDSVLSVTFQMSLTAAERVQAAVILSKIASELDALYAPFPASLTA